MTAMDIKSYACGDWVSPGPGARSIADAVTGEVFAQAGNESLDVASMRDHARSVGGPALRAMGFHDRAKMLKALALHLDANKDALYQLSYRTGATLADSKIDIDGGIGTMLVFASKGRREMPDGHVYIDGGLEQLSRDGSFVGQHVCTPLQGVAVQINAFNFPVWGMLEKLAPALLAGVPVIVKPATASCYLTEACFRLMIASGLLPKGSAQLVTGGLGDLLDRLDCQDVVSFTGSAATATMLRTNPHLVQNSVRFMSEQDSLNASVLGPDAAPGTPEFDLFIKEAQREMTAKAGQKCTAIRRIFAPTAYVDAVISALSERLASTVIGAPELDSTRMGALVSQAQREDVRSKITMLECEAERVFGDPASMIVNGANSEKGAFVPPTLLLCSSPESAQHVHETEAFGPVSTVMGYNTLDQAFDLVNRGGGSLVASVITNDADVARRAVLTCGAYHGRIYFNNRVSMKAATGHGSPLPHMVHGGPGRAGGGEELGGVRGVMHYMQRTAVQGSPDFLTTIGNQWVAGATETPAPAHPFTRTFNELAIGETIHTASRDVTHEDIEHFAAFTGDTFYAHMDEDAAARNPFFPGRVAHGYLLLSFAAGLFVEPNEGPVLANTGLHDLKFMKPVQAGAAIKARLTVKKKTRRTDTYGEVRWNVTLSDQEDDTVAEYELHTMNAY